VKIYLSPSNQNDNPYWSGVGGTERDWMNRVADVTQRELAKQHQVFRAGLTTPIGNGTAEGTRPVEANRLGVDLYLAIHSDGANGQARGTTTFCYPESANGLRFAQAVNRRIMEIYPGPNRGIKTDNKLTELKATNAPAVLVEIAFHDNPTDARWITSNVEAIGIALAKAVNDYADITTAPSTPTPTPTPAPAAPAIDKPAIRLGASGDAVEKMQILLNKKINAGLAVDRDFGKLSDRALRAFQTLMGIDIDGVCGPVTWKLLLA